MNIIICLILFKLNSLHIFLQGFYESSVCFPFGCSRPTSTPSCTVSYYSEETYLCVRKKICLAFIYNNFTDTLPLSSSIDVCALSE